MNKRLFYLLFYSTSDKIIFYSFPVLFFYFLILSFYSLSILCFQKHLFFYDFQEFCEIIDDPFGRGELLTGSVAISHGTGLAAGMMRHIYIEVHIAYHESFICRSFISFNALKTISGAGFACSTSSPATMEENISSSCI